jgi:hypothetical protein
VSSTIRTPSGSDKRICHVIRQVITDLVWIPRAPRAQPLQAVRGGMAGMLGKLPAVLPPGRAKQPAPEVAYPPPRLRPVTASPVQVGGQLLGLLDDLQSGGPVVVIIEDVHWTDSDSLQSIAPRKRRVPPRKQIPRSGRNTVRSAEPPPWAVARQQATIPAHAGSGGRLRLSCGQSVLNLIQPVRPPVQERLAIGLVCTH